MDESDSGAKRKRGEEGLLGLLGTYASDEEEVEVPETLKRQRSTEDAAGRVESSDMTRPKERMDDLLSALKATSQQLEEAQLIEQAPERSKLKQLGTEVEKDIEMEESEADLYWLPPEIAQPPVEPCSQDIQDKVAEYIEKQEARGATISSTLRSLSGYRNPDFLQHCVMYDNISEYGTCYPADIFDPTNLPAEDYYDRLAVEWQQQAERQRAERSKTSKIEFAKSGSETLGRSSASGLNASTVAASLVAAQNKGGNAGLRASKWDTKR